MPFTESLLSGPVAEVPQVVGSDDNTRGSGREACMAGTGQP